MGCALILALVLRMRILRRSDAKCGRTFRTRISEEPGNVFLEVASDLRVARTFSRVDATKVPDMSDRTIAAAALYPDVPVISKDAQIQLSGFTTIW
jgi:hypothetical protein